MQTPTYSIREHRDKNGKLISFYIRMYGGTDELGKTRKAPFTTFRIPDDVHWSEDTARKRAASYAATWAKEQKEQLQLGVVPDTKITFAAYAAAKLQQNAEEGEIKHSTYVRYLDFLKAIDPWLGKKKIVDIGPMHIEKAIEEIRAAGTITETTIAIPGVFECIVPTEKACPQLMTEFSGKGVISKSALSRASGVSLYTVKRAIGGENISRSTGAAISNALGYDFDDLFDYRRTRVDLADKTILEHFRLISSILSDAVGDHLIAENPAKLAKHPKYHAKEAEWYDPEDVKTILEVLQEEAIYWIAIVTVLIYTGARKGEALGLSESDIDINKCTLHFCKSLLYSADIGMYIEDTTKTRKNRTVKVPRCVIETLEEYNQWKKEVGIKPNDKWAQYGLIFTNAKGNPIHPDSVNDFLTKFASRKELSHIHPHAFRHTAASTLIYAGADIVSVADMLGHGTPTTTAKVYAHVIQAAKEKMQIC